MGWARLDDSFHDHPKLIGLSLEALGLWTKCFTWAHRHHGSSIILGHLPDGLAETFAGSRATKLVKELEMHRLWDIEDGLGGWVIHDYVDYLPATERPATANEVRSARSAAGKRGADARWAKASGSQEDGNLPSDSDSKPMPPTRPDPNLTDLATDVAKELRRSALVDIFEEAYRFWPKKVKRDEALSRFLTAAKTRNPDELADDIKRFGEAYERTTETKYVPALGPWLYQKRWTDELPSATPAKRDPDAWMQPRPTRTDQNLAYVNSLGHQQMEIGQ